MLASITLSAASHAATYHVILLGGQSNMDGNGNALTANLPAALQQPQTDVLYNNRINTAGTATESYYTGPTLTALQPGSVSNPDMDHFGPEITLGRQLADDHPQNKYVIIKYAVAGASLSNNWFAPNATSSSTGNCYAAFKQSVASALALIPKGAGGQNDYQIDAMCWVQGEADAGGTDSAEKYQGRLNDLIVDVRKTYGANLPFIIGGIGYVAGVTDTNTGYVGQNTRTIVQNAFTAEAATAPGVVYFNNDDLNPTKQLHFDATGQQAIGRRFASAIEAVPEPGMVGILALVAVCAGRRYRVPSIRA